MRAGLAMALAVAAVMPGIATAADLVAQRQASLNWTLTDETLASVTRQRAACAGGQQPALVASRRAAGFTEAPGAADYCVTLLTRLGRLGMLGFVRDIRGSAPTPALAFDNGFVMAYRKAEPLPAGLPTMVMLRTAAERCLMQREPNITLCQSVGYAYGTRAAHGEVVTVR